MRRYHLILCLAILVAGCEKITYFPDREITVNPTRLIAHRGGGNYQLRENTMEAIKPALRSKDGIEVDVQLSNNQTVWLSHSSIVEACENSPGCFPATDDEDISAISVCDGKDISYTKLEEVFVFMRDSFPDKLVSIDLKAWPPCGIGSLDVIGTMRFEAETIISLAEEYGLSANLIFETETAAALNFIKSKNPDTEVYLTTFGDFEKAMLLCLREGYNGISFQNNDGEELTKEKIDMLHRKGLRIMVWNLHSEAEVQILTGIGVDYIQQDL